MPDFSRFAPMVQALMSRFPNAGLGAIAPRGSTPAALPNAQGLGGNWDQMKSNLQGMFPNQGTGGGSPLGGSVGSMFAPGSFGHAQGNPDPRPMPSTGYNTGIVPPGMGQPAPAPRPDFTHMGPGSGLAPPSNPTPRPMGPPMPTGAARINPLTRR